MRYRIIMSKETIEEFLKPNKQKLLVFLILFSILFLVAPSSVSCPGPSTKFDKIEEPVFL